MPSRAISLTLLLGLVVGLGACVVAPVSVEGDAPALWAAQSILVIKVGEQRDLLPFVRVRRTGAVPFVPLTWEVSNPSLLSIDPGTGRAKGLSPGTAVVQVVAEGNRDGATQMLIRVVGEGPTVVKEIQVQPGSHSMAVGEELTLTAQVFMPDGQINGNVTWASSDDTIATINPTNGVARALRPGRVTIVAGYALDPSFKGLADIFVYPTRAEIPASPAAMRPSWAPNSESPLAVTASPASSVTGAMQPQPKISPQAPSRPLVAQTPPKGTFVVTTMAGAARGFFDGVGTDARFNEPFGVAVDDVGNVYVADKGNHRIRKVGVDGVVTTLAGSTRGNLDGVGVKARFNEPVGVAVDGAGNVYVADKGNHRIRKVSATGVVTSVAGSVRGYFDGRASVAMFRSPCGVAVDDAGNLYVADTENHRIRKVGVDGFVTTLAGADQASVGSLRVWRGNVDGAGSAAQFWWPTGVAVDRRSGDVFVWEDTSLVDNHVLDDRLRKVSPQGIVSTLAVFDHGGNARRLSLNGLAVDARGNVYVSNSYGSVFNYIEKVHPDGLVTTLAGVGAKGGDDGLGQVAAFDLPSGVAVDSAGCVYVADRGNDRIRKMTPLP